VSVGKRLREERERLGIKQFALAEKMRVSRVSQSNYERGTSDPNSEYWQKLDALGFDIYYILTGKRKT
jgi:transcriptional regulator with XRE-family HTH domain